MATITSISSRPQITAARVEALRGYFKSYVLNGDDFRCGSFAHCSASHSGAFFEGQLHHVGRHYDLDVNGCPMRVMVVGKDYGNWPPKVDLTERHRMVLHETGLSKRFRAEPGYPARNRHMRGTTSVLRLLLGRGLGCDHDSELLALSGEAAHIFDTFSLANFLLCSAIAGEQSSCVGDGAATRIVSSKPSRSTPTMRKNCAPHFKKALEILEPTVVVAQGTFGWLEQHVFDRTERVTEALHLAFFGTSRCLVAAFTHPSAHDQLDWGNNERSPYLLSTVVPTVARIHERLLPGVGPHPRLVKRPN